MAHELMNRNNNDWFGFPEDPFFNDGWDRLFSRSFPRSFSNMLTDVKEDKDKYEVAIDIPGVDKNKISLDYHNDELKVSYHNTKKTEDKDSEGHLIHSERRYGSFQRVYTFPDIDAQKINAVYRDGVLHVTLPKLAPEAPNPKKIEIK